MSDAVAQRTPAIPGAERSFVEIDTPDAGRIRIAVETVGAGPPVLLIHGFPQHAGTWRKVAPRLAAAGYQAICPDLRGFGLSDAPGRGYDTDTFAADLLLVLDALGHDRAYVMGHDWGGFAGFTLSIEHPDRVAAYIALNTFSPWVERSFRVMKGMWRSWYAIALSLFGQWVLRVKPGPIPRSFSADAVHAGITDADAEGYAAHLRPPERARAGALLYRGFLRSALKMTSGGPFKGRRLAVPTLFLFGTKDRWVATGGTTGFEAHSDEGTLELVHDSGHFIGEEKPEFVAERALEYFARFK